jgi:hypothetical protein
MCRSRYNHAYGYGEDSELHAFQVNITAKKNDSIQSLIHYKLTVSMTIWNTSDYANKNAENSVYIEMLMKVNDHMSEKIAQR